MSSKTTNNNKLQISESLSNDNRDSKKSDSIHISKLTLHLLINKIFFKFKNKYNHMPDQYETNIIDNIIYNEKSHVVSQFKDLLIAYDYSDYLKRYYTNKESWVRLPKYYEYYNLYSKIFPNYTSIPEGKYFYLNIQRKQRMIDLQEKMENENSMEKKLNNNNKNDKKTKNDNVFNTSVVNSILNRTNKEEMEMLFDIDFENIKKNESIFVEKINKLIELINACEIKEDYYIDYNYESRNKKIKKKESMSPLMNININYINFNKFNEDKTNSINNQSKNNIFLYKLFNIPMKDDKKTKNEINKNKKFNSKEKDYSLFMMKINQLKKNKKIFTKMDNYLKYKYLPNHNNNNQHNSFINNQSYNLKRKTKNKTIAYDNSNRNKSLNNNLILNRDNKSLKNIFSYKSSFAKLSSDIKNNNLNNNSKIRIKSPLSSRNKSRNDDINLYLTNKYFNHKKAGDHPINDTKSKLPKKETNFYNLINNSRNKNYLNNNIQSSINNISSKKYNFIQNSISPTNNKIKLKEKNKIRKNNSFLNKTVFSRQKFNNNIDNKDKILLNNFIKESNKNTSLLINKNYSESLKTKKLNHSNSTRKINDFKNIINKKNIKGVYINKFLKAFNSSIKPQHNFPLTQREYKK